MVELKSNIKNSLLCVVTSFFCLCCNQKQNVVLLDTELKNYKDLDSWITNKRIVFLGEPTHGDGTIFKARINFIKYLHKHHGFNTVVFESNGYDAELANLMIDSGKPAIETFRKSTFEIWGKAKELEELWNYFSENKEISFFGMDSYPHELMKTFFLSNLENSLKLEEEDKENIKNIINSIASVNIKSRNYKFSNSQIETLNKINNSLNDSSSRLLKLGINNLLGYNEISSISQKINNSWLKFNKRDSLMFQQLKKISSNNQKIIVWLATAHSIENGGKLDQYLADGSSKFSGMINLGDLGKEFFGESMLNIGFTAFTGEYRDYYDGKNYPFKLDSAKGIEYWAYSKYQNPVWVDLKKIDTAFYSGVLGFESMKSQWKDNLDALIIIPYVEASSIE